MMKSDDRTLNLYRILICWTYIYIYTYIYINMYMHIIASSYKWNMEDFEVIPNCKRYIPWDIWSALYVHHYITSYNTISISHKISHQWYTLIP